MKLISITLLGGFLSAFFFGCTSQDVTAERRQGFPQFSAPGSRADVNLETYIIKKGDEVQINVWGYPEFNTATTVKEVGTIAVSLIGELQIEGLTIDQVKKMLLRKLGEYIQGEIKLSVTVGSSVGQKITVLGTVVRQDNYPAKTDMTLLEVLSAAGGTTPESDLHHIKIYPLGNDSNPVEIDLSWYMENGGITRLPSIKPGDTIFVPKRENLFRDFSDFARDVIVLFGFFRLFN